MSPSTRRKVLFVCTANICRSPAAELLARHRFGEQDMMFRSAGFLVADQPCPEPMIEVLGQRGIEAADHRSYNLDQESIDAADILLTMESSHVQKATLIDQAVFPKILPLKEARDILAARPEHSVPIETLLQELNTNRDARQYLGQRWDVRDPYGGRLREYRTAVDELEELVGLVVGRLA